MLPQITMHCDNPAHPADQPRDYPRSNPGDPSGGAAWPPCPVCGSTMVEAHPSLPLQQSATVIRYFLGLRYNDPTCSTVNMTTDQAPFGWMSPWNGNVAAGDGNQVVLYRVEFNPYDNTLFPGGRIHHSAARGPELLLQRGHEFQRGAILSKLGKYRRGDRHRQVSGSGKRHIRGAEWRRISDISNRHIHIYGNGKRHVFGGLLQ